MHQLKQQKSIAVSDSRNHSKGETMLENDKITYIICARPTKPGSMDHDFSFTVFLGPNGNSLTDETVFLTYRDAADAAERKIRQIIEKL